VSILGPKMGKNWGFFPLKFVNRTHMNTPVGDKLFPDIPCRVAKFRENWPRDDEKSVAGKNIKN